MTNSSTKCLLSGTALAVLLAFAPVNKANADGLFGDMMQGPHDWRGLYVGGQVGYAKGDYDFVIPNGLGFFELEPGGVIGGGHVGYNWQIDDIVFGIVGDANLTDLEDEQVFPMDNAGFTTDTEFTASLRIKMGITVDRALFYVTGGGAVATVDHSVLNTGNGDLFNYNERWLAGYTVGGGVEYAFNNWLSMFVEYRWTDLGEESFGARTLVSSTPAHSIELNYHQVQAGVSVSLGDWCAGM